MAVGGGPGEGHGEELGAGAVGGQGETVEPNDSRGSKCVWGRGVSLDLNPDPPLASCVTLGKASVSPPNIWRQ